MNKLDFDKFKLLLKHNNLSTGKIDISEAQFETEKKANITIGRIMLILCVFYALFIVLSALKIFFANTLAGIITTSLCFVCNLVVGIFAIVLNGEGRKLKYIILFTSIFSNVAITLISGYEFWILLVLPIVFSCNYYRFKLTIIVCVFVEVFFAITIVLGAYISVNAGWIDVNYAGVKVGEILHITSNISDAVINSSSFSMKEYIGKMYLYVFLPNSLVLLFIAIIGIQNSLNGWRLLIEESQVLVAKTKAEKESADAKTQIMLSQIQPHFIYNTLNSIYYLCDKEPQTAKKAISEFSDYLRTNLNFMDKKAFVSFEQEMEHIKKYLSLEKMRFEDELNIVYDIECTTFKVPALSIQPLVENAVKHGVCKRTNGGTVHIWSKDVLSHFEIGIEDDGVGFDVNKPFDDNRRHIGLENTRTRLQEMCNATVEISSEIGVGTSVIIKLPKENYYEDTGSR